MSTYGFAIPLGEEGFGQSRQNLREQCSRGRAVLDFSCSWLIKLSSVLICEERLVYPLGSCDLATPGVGRQGRSRENPKPNQQIPSGPQLFLVLLDCFGESLANGKAAGMNW